MKYSFIHVETLAWKMEYFPRLKIERDTKNLLIVCSTQNIIMSAKGRKNKKKDTKDLYKIKIVDEDGSTLCWL